MSTVFKQLLHERNYTVESFAKENNLSKRSLDPYVSGARSFAKTQAWFFMKIVDGLKVDPHVLLESEFVSVSKKKAGE